MNKVAGVIGCRNHSQKIIKILLSNKNIKTIVVYCHNKKTFKKKILENKNKKIIYINNFELIKKSNFFFIASPTTTHFFYIKKLLNCGKAIFCEKPGFVNFSEYTFLKKLNYKYKKKIFFNYNLLHSKLFKYIKKENLNDKLVNVAIYSSTGISFLKKFKNNWRFKSKNILERITGNLGSHHVNFLLNLLGKIKTSLISESGIAYKKKIDTCNLNLFFSNGTSANIFLSYALPLTDRMEFYFTNKIVIYENNKIFSAGPRETFDKLGLFKKPSKKILFKFPKDLGNDSLINSVHFFVDNVLNKRFFNISYFNNAMSTGNFFLKNKAYFI